MLLATYLYIMEGGTVLKNLFKIFLIKVLTAEIITLFYEEGHDNVIRSPESLKIHFAN